MRIAFAQIDPVVGDFDANTKKIKEVYHRALIEGARLVLTPELGICGYPPHDLLERPEIFERNVLALSELTALTKGQKCALAVGYVAVNPNPTGRYAQNVASILENGKIVFTQAKTLLPTYDVFDEARYFEPADVIRLWNCDGRKLALAICEDLWGSEQKSGRRLYGKNPIEKYRQLGAQLIVSLSASPYEWGKRVRRLEIHQEIAKNLQIPLVYLNQVGATDEILFDGGSFALNQQGDLIGQLPAFQNGFGYLDISETHQINWKGPNPDVQSEIAILAEGLVRGIFEYFKRTGFRKAVIGLSGGIDSAVVGALAVRALGSENVLGVAMPSQYSSQHSLEDAELLARKTKMSFEVRPIKFLNSVLIRELSEKRGHLAPLALENLQARLRGVILMTFANHDSALVLTTGNKSELATGYCTLYGDMVGALAPLGDLVKTRVYELARYMNAEWASPIPERCLTKPPSAELKPNQVDQDTLPPYEVLDPVLIEYIENHVPVRELEKKYDSLFTQGWVRDILRRLEMNEYKRRQSAPVLKVSSKAFGMGRRIPIAKRWDQRVI